MFKPQLEIDRHRNRLSGQELVDAYYERVDVRGGVAQFSRWLGCTFYNCRFDAAAFGDATFDRCRFVRCSFTSKVTLVSRIYRTTFDSCDFDDAIFVGADIQGSSFRRSRAQRSDWSRATVQDTLLDMDFHGAVLNFAVTKNVDFTGANLWGAMLPFNCAGFTSNTFDDRQIMLFICLLGQGKSELAKAMEKGVDPWYRAVFKRLLRLQA